VVRGALKKRNPNANRNSHSLESPINSETILRFSIRQTIHAITPNHDLEQAITEQITAGECACHADGEADGDGEEAEQQQIDRMLLVVVVQRAQHCGAKGCTPISAHRKKKIPQKTRELGLPMKGRMIRKM